MRKWSAHSLELHGLMRALQSCEHLILPGQDIFVLTDNSSIVHFNTLHFNNSRQKRLLAYLQSFRLHIFYTKGKKLEGPDCLSRVFETMSENEISQFHPPEIEDFIFSINPKVYTEKTDECVSMQSFPETLTSGVINLLTNMNETTKNKLERSYPSSLKALFLNNNENICFDSESDSLYTQMHEDNGPSEQSARPTNENSVSSTLNVNATNFVPKQSAYEESASSHVSVDNIINATRILRRSSSTTDVNISNSECTPTGENISPLIEGINANIPPLSASVYENDDNFSYIWKYLKNNELSNDKKIDYKTLLLAPLYTIQNDRLYRFVLPRGKTKSRSGTVEKVLCIPHLYENTVLTEFHKQGHNGGEKLFNTLRTYVFFPKMYESCLQTSRSCLICQQAKINRSKQVSPLRPLPNFRIGEAISVDFKNLPRLTKEGYKYILVFTELFSKFVMYEPTVDTTAVTTGKCFIKRILPLFCNCKLILSDNAQNFRSHLIKYLCKVLNWRHLRSSAVSSTFNGGAENSILNLNRAIALHVPNDRSIAEFLPILELYNNITVNKSTGYSPIEILFGVRPTLNLNGDILADDSPIQPPHEYVEQLRDRLKSIQQDVERNKNIAQKRMKIQYDKKPYIMEPTFTVGQKVFLERLTPKARSDNIMTHKPFVGPYYITEIVGDKETATTGPLSGQISPELAQPSYAYKLVSCSTGKPLRHLVASKRLKPCIDNLRFHSEHPQFRNTDIDSNIDTQVSNSAHSDRPDVVNSDDNNDDDSQTTNNNEWYTVKRIDKKRRRKGKLQFHCLFTDGTSQWVDDDNVTSYAKTLFFERMANRKRKRRRN